MTVVVLTRQHKMKGNGTERLRAVRKTGKGVVGVSGQLLEPNGVADSTVTRTFQGT